MRYFIILFIFISSCATKKDVLFIQDLDESDISNVKYNEIIIQEDDILKIQVTSQSPELTQLFNISATINANALENYQLNGYLVNAEGFISFPLLGSIKVKGLTLNQISKLIATSLVTNGELLNPTVDVKIVNAYFTILGEVNKPGRYSFIKNNMDILQAIGIAGDLTINGQRKNVKILRRLNDKLKVSSVDLTSSDFFASPNFQIIPGDIIIVDPNNSRVKNAGIIGNAGNLLSVLSFILSSIILITSN